jgi:hypothetical protein
VSLISCRLPSWQGLILLTSGSDKDKQILFRVLMEIPSSEGEHSDQLDHWDQVTSAVLAKTTKKIIVQFFFFYNSF